MSGFKIDGFIRDPELRRRVERPYGFTVPPVIRRGMPTSVSWEGCNPTEQRKERYAKWRRLAWK